MSLHFPDPTLTRTFTAANGITYTFNGTAWDAGTLPNVPAPAGLKKVDLLEGPTAPPNAVDGTIWADTSAGHPNIKIYRFNAATGAGQWVAAVVPDGVTIAEDPTGADRQFAVNILDMGTM